MDDARKRADRVCRRRRRPPRTTMPPLEANRPFVANRFLDEHVSFLKETTKRLHTLAAEQHLRPGSGNIPIADGGQPTSCACTSGLKATPYMAN